MKGNFFTRRNKPEDGNLIPPSSEPRIRRNKELFTNIILKCMLNKTFASDHERSDNTYISWRISSPDTERNLGKPLVKTFL